MSTATLQLEYVCTHVRDSSRKSTDLLHEIDAALRIAIIVLVHQQITLKWHLFCQNRLEAKYFCYVPYPPSLVIKLLILIRKINSKIYLWNRD